MTDKTVLLDCTLRDGGYYNRWDFSKSLITEYLHAMATLGVDFVELGFRSLETEGFKGCTAYTTDTFIRGLDAPPSLKLGVMVNASELTRDPASMEERLSALFPVAAGDSPITLVRLACHYREFEAALPAADWLHARNYLVAFNVMQIADRSAEEMEKLARAADVRPIDVLYFADSLGSLIPQGVSGIIASLRRGWSGPIGVHTHDNMGNALANALQAVQDGATWVDGTVTGMGRGPGNAKTEYLAIELAENRPKQGSLTPLLTLINRHFLPLKRKYNWGTNPYYYLAGKHGIHPTYVQAMLSDSRYSEEDGLAVIEHLRAVGGKKFDHAVMEAARVFYTGEPRGSWAPKELMSGREVLILGTGPGVQQHRSAVEDYIRTCRPFVIALNTKTSVSPDLIDVRAACHPVRLLADCEEYSKLPQPLITPASMLPDLVLDAFGDQKLLDFGLQVKDGTFGFSETFCLVPQAMVMAYALAVATSGEASLIRLAGFDGYEGEDPRNTETEAIFLAYTRTEGALPLVAITPTRYRIPTTSVYALAQ